jgi:hypothetical protein
MEGSILNPLIECFALPTISSQATAAITSVKTEYQLRALTRFACLLLFRERGRPHSTSTTSFIFLDTADASF